MPLALLAFAALVIIALGALWFVKTPPARLARQLRAMAGVALGLLALVLISRGAITYALPLAVLALWLFLRNGSGGGSRAPSEGQTSRVRTAHLEMELEHESGAMRGRVLKGVFAGRDIERMAPAELALLWQDCRFEDPQSAQLIEAYLDRIHPTWREDLAKAESEVGPGGKMTVEEAYDILGLKPKASEAEIRQAHRDLMKKLHPDRGGSSYLAAKINEAKELLLGQR
jgi:DnaJ-domain-containing protein 1